LIHKEKKEPNFAVNHDTWEIFYLLVKET